MIGIVISTHGELGNALLETARMVVDNDVLVLSVGLQTSDTSGTYEPRLQAAIDEAETGDGVLILTDMFGGTPSNLGMTRHEPGKVEILTGVNLPMLIKALQLVPSGLDLTEVSHRVRVSGQQSIAVATEVLSGGFARLGAQTPAAEPEA